MRSVAVSGDANLYTIKEKKREVENSENCSLNTIILLMFLLLNTRDIRKDGLVAYI